MSYDRHIQSGRTMPARCAIITLSDTRDESTDTSGQLIRDLLRQNGHTIAHYRIIPDEPAALGALLQEFLAAESVDAVLTNGGTGISRRDQTIAVVDEHLDKPIPGFGELFRMLSWEQIKSGSMMSRAVAGISRGKPVFSMPGSKAAVELAMTQLILPELGHILYELRK